LSLACTAGLVCFVENFLIMLQRIQSVFLLIMALAMLAMFFVPIAVTISPDTPETVILNAFYMTWENTETGQILSKPTWYISALALLSILVSSYSITRWDNRLTQMKLGLLNSLLVAGVVGLNAYFATKGKTLIASNPPANFTLGFFLPVIALLFNSLANRFIRRDEKLVRDADRLR
jgi:glucan phosphoethanolaminetransferase (alkaline phosphatase superfamily)